MKDLDTSTIDAYRKISTGTIGHFLEEVFLDWRIQCLFRPVKMVGRALTITTPPRTTPCSPKRSSGHNLATCS